MNYKDIAIELRKNILEEIELENQHSRNERDLWNKAMEIGKENQELGEQYYRQAQGEEKMARNHDYNVRRLRTALWNMLEILGVPFDSFHPELAEF